MTKLFVMDVFREGILEESIKFPAQNQMHKELEKKGLKPLYVATDPSGTNFTICTGGYHAITYTVENDI